MYKVLQSKRSFCTHSITSHTCATYFRNYFLNSVLWNWSRITHIFKSQRIAFSICPEVTGTREPVYPLYIRSSSSILPDHAPVSAHSSLQTGKGTVMVDVAITVAVFSMRAGKKRKKPAHEFSFLCDSQAITKPGITLGYKMIITKVVEASLS